MWHKTDWDTLLLCDYLLSYKKNTFVVENNQVVGVKKGRIVFVKNISSVDSEFEKLFKLKNNITGFVKKGENSFYFPSSETEAGSASLSVKKVYRFKNHVLSPGFVNTHTHLPMSLFRGVADNLPLKEWLEDYIFPLENQFVKEDFVATGTRLAVLELIKSGVTTVCNMYFYEQTVAKVLDQVGLRGVVCFHIPHIRKTHFPESEWKPQTLELQKKYQGHARIQIGISPHAPYTVSAQDLKKIGELAKAEDLLLSIHVSESQWEQDEFCKKHKKTPIEYLHHLGLSGKHALFVHCVQANKTDLQIMQDTGTALSYNPESNMKLSNGIAPVTSAIHKGISVGLGTDGSASNNNLNFFGEMDFGLKLQALKYGDQSINFMDMFKIATIEGAKALNLDQDIGTIEDGKWADIIAIDLRHPQLQPIHNLLSNIVYSAGGGVVDFVMCGGQVLMDNYQVQALDSSSIYAEAGVFTKKIQDFLNLSLTKPR